MSDPRKRNNNWGYQCRKAYLRKEVPKKTKKKTTKNKNKKVGLL